MKIIIWIKSGTLLGNIWGEVANLGGGVLPPKTGLQEALDIYIIFRIRVKGWIGWIMCFLKLSFCCNAICNENRMIKQLVSKSGIFIQKSKVVSSLQGIHPLAICLST